MPRKMIKQDERYHDTLLLLKKYRDVVWYKAILGNRRKKYADSIIRLSDKLIKR